MHYAIYSQGRQSYFSVGHGWSVWSYNARLFQSEKAATDYINLLGLQLTTSKDILNGAYVVGLTFSGKMARSL